MKLAQKKSSKNKNTHRIIISLAVVLLLISGAMYFLLRDASIKTLNGTPTEAHTPENSSPPDTTGAVSQEIITNKPDDKLHPAQNDQPKENHTTNNGQRTISINTSSDSNANSVFIRGMLGGSVDAGTCTASLRGPSGKTISVQTPVLPGPSMSSCKTVQLEKTSLEPGIWKYTLSFSSDNIKGVSNENSFEI